MPPTTRIIPCLDVADGRVVKGVQFENLVDSGDPIELALRYYREGADELTFLDVKASKEAKQIVLELVRATAEQVFIPLTVGGGIRAVDDVARLLDAGADKISIGSAVFDNPRLLSDIAARFGSQVLVVSLDLKRDLTMPSGFTATSHGGTRNTGVDALELVATVQELGAGELLVNSMDADGTRNGFDLDLLEQVLDVSNVPVIASGGAGSANDFVKAAEVGVDACLAASIFHNHEVSILEVKSALRKAGNNVRSSF